MTNSRTDIWVNAFNGTYRLWLPWPQLTALEGTAGRGVFAIYGSICAGTATEAECRETVHQGLTGGAAAIVDGAAITVTPAMAERLASADHPLAYWRHIARELLRAAIEGRHPTDTETAADGASTKSAVPTYVGARGGAINAIRDAGGQRPAGFVAGVQIPDAGTTDPIKLKLRELAAEAVRTRRPINDLVLDVRKLVGDRPEYRALVRTITAQGAAAVTAAQSVERLKAEQALLSGTATKAQKALLGMGLVTTGLIDKQVALATATTALERARARLSLVEERGRSIQAGDGAALTQYRSDLTKATTDVAAAEKAERAAADAKRDSAKATRDAARAEWERIRQLRQDGRESRDLIGLQSELAGAKGQLTADSRLQDEFQRDRIKLDQRGRIGAYAEARDRGDLTKAEFAERKQLVDEIATSQLALVNYREAIRTAEEELTAARAGIDNQRDVLNEQLDLADTRDKRRAIETRLLDLAIEEQRLQAQKIIDLAATGKATEEEARLARERLKVLPTLKRLGQKKIDEASEGPLASYKRTLTGDLNHQIEDIEVQGLRALEASLTDSTKAALGLSGALGDIVGELIRIGIQRAIIGPLADSLFGPSGGGGAGGGGGLIGSAIAIASNLFGGKRAAGGPVSAGKTYLVGERGPELLRMGGTAGTVIPNDRLRSSLAAAQNIASVGAAAAAPRQAPQPPAVVQVMVGKGELFEPTVRRISGNVSTSIVQSAAPQITRQSVIASREDLYSRQVRGTGVY